MNNRLVQTLLVLTVVLINTEVSKGQEFNKTRITGALSIPELINAGISLDLNKSSQIGLTLGKGARREFGINLEHRLYLGTISKKTSRRKWFVRQGYSLGFDPCPKNATASCTSGTISFFTVTVGGDLKSKYPNKGWTIDFGAFYLTEESYVGHILPALRVQYYGYLKK